MCFYILDCIIFTIESIRLNTFCSKSIYLTVNALYQILLSFHNSSLFIKNWLICVFIKLACKIFHSR